MSLKINFSVSPASGIKGVRASQKLAACAHTHHLTCNSRLSSFFLYWPLLFSFLAVSTVTTETKTLFKEAKYQNGKKRWMIKGNFVRGFRIARWISWGFPSEAFILATSL